MELTYACPHCGAEGSIHQVEEAYSASCASCGSHRQLNRSASAESGLSACVWCATDDLYLQKDFPHNLGLAIVVVGFAVSTVFWALYMPISAFSVLLFTAGLDVVLFYLVPDVTICYRCLSQHRGQGSNPDDRFAAFDLAIGERYRQERLRIEELRASQTNSSP